MPIGRHQLSLPRGASLSLHPHMIAQGEVFIDGYAPSIGIKLNLPMLSSKKNSHDINLKLTLGKPALSVPRRANPTHHHSQEMNFTAHIREKQLSSLKVSLRAVKSTQLITMMKRLFHLPLKSLQPKSHFISASFDGQATFKAQSLTFDLSLLQPSLSIIGLPRLNWPKVNLAGALKYHSAKASSHSERHSEEWFIPRLRLSAYSPSMDRVNFDLSAVLELRNRVKLRASDQPSPSWISSIVNLKRVKRLSLELEAEPGSCQTLYEVIPPQLLGPLKSAKLNGEITPKLKVIYPINTSANTDSKEKIIDLTISGIRRACRFDQLTLDLAPSPKVTKRRRRLDVIDVTWLNEPFSYTINSKYTKGKKVIVGPEQANYIPYDELPSYVGGAMYLTEETGFWRGGAISPNLLKRAVNTNLKEGRFVYGGSTITQQLVKNLFLHREKTLARKLQEALISARIVDAVSKQRVLELYLNMIEFGPNIYGIQAAAKYYFQRDARTLSPEEAIFLAMLKVAPHRGPKWMKRGSSPRFTWWKSRTIQIFDRLVKEGLITQRRARGAAPYVLKWSDGKYIGSETL